LHTNIGKKAGLTLSLRRPIERKKISADAAYRLAVGLTHFSFSKALAFGLINN